MSRVPNIDPIDYLVHRHYPDAANLEDLVRRRREQTEAVAMARRASATNLDAPAPSCSTLSEPLQVLGDQSRWAEIKSYRQCLKTMATEEIAALVAEEQAKERLEAQRQAEKEEAQRFFNGPNCAPDYDHYCLLANWTLDEAVALSFGKNPEVVNWSTIRPLVQVSIFAKNYSKRRELVLRAKWAKQLYDPVYPSIFLSWAKSRFPVSDRLAEVAVEREISLQGWSDLYQEAVHQWKAEVETLKGAQSSELTATRAALVDHLRHISELEAQLGASKNGEKPLGTRERENLQMLALVGAIRGFGFDPDRRTGAVAEIERALEKLGHEFRDDRIRFHLQKGAENLRPGWRERLGMKPNSGSR